MCGIVGIFDTQAQRTIAAPLLQNMVQSLEHRGPDDGRVMIKPGIGLGHRRLSIIGLADGAQPMSCSNETLWVVFNGEIYNFKALRQTLEQKGYSFRTQSDTEVLLHGYRHWGRELCTKLRGMFAFAIYDEPKRTLFLARDRLGIKPLYYTMDASGQLVFGSELKAIRPFYESLSLNPQAIADYFAYGYVPEPKTIYQDVFKLEPGTTLTVAWGSQELKRQTYWQIPSYEPRAMAESQAIDKLQESLLDSVKARLISEVPIGAFLSGGVDSSVVVSQMAQCLDSVTTCAIGFDEQAFDESAYAQKVASHLHTHHHSHQVSHQQALDFDKIIGIYDEPFADSSCIPTLKVCEAARQHVTVALSGDGGDEVFAGYRRYKGHRLEQQIRQRCPQFLRRYPIRFLASAYPRLQRGPRFLRAKATFESLSFNAIEGYFYNISLFKPHWHQALWSRDFEKQLAGYQPLSVLEEHAKSIDSSCPVNLVQCLDMKTYLPGDILTKVDRASMHHSLEVRVPLLDPKVIALAQGLATPLKLKQNTTKYILKKAYESQLPHDILYRKKQGFAVPLAQWFRGPLKHLATQLPTELADAQLFDSTVVSRIVRDHMNEQSDNSAMLWSLCVFSSFLKSQRLNYKEERHATTACA